MPEDPRTATQASLCSYLTEQLDEQIVDTTVLETGLNRIIRVATPDDPQAYVLRQPNEGRDGAGFIDINTEHAVLERLEPTDVPVPAPVHLCEDASVLGTPFSVIEYVTGEAIGWEESLPAGYRAASTRRRVGKLLIDRLAALHSAGTGQFDDICERVPLREQVTRTVDQLTTATNVTAHDPVRLWRVADWLQDAVPEQEQTEPALVHGDYKPDNVLFAWTEQPAVAAILDWETAALLDPRTELGYFLFYWRDPGDPAPDLDPVSERHPAVAADIREREQAGFWPFTKQPGSPSRGALAKRWEQATGNSYDDDRFYRAFGAVMLATVWEQLYATALDRGETTTDPEREAHIEYVAALAEAIRDGRLPLSV